MKQMVREIAGFMEENKCGLAEVMEEYCSGMSSKKMDKIEDLYYEMKESGELDDIKGVQ